MNERTSGRSSYSAGPRRWTCSSNANGKLRALLELAPENDERPEREPPEQRIQVGGAYEHCFLYAIGPLPPPSGAPRSRVT